jgi:hypothetical protein
VSRGVAVSGVVLAGLAPGAALLTLTSESPISAAFFAILGLCLGSFLGVREVGRAAGEGMEGGRLALRTLLVGFVLLAALVAARTWWLVLPMLGRGATT